MEPPASFQQTLSTDLMAHLGDEHMMDLHLLGSDGVKVPAFRTILACRSDVFHKMLFGDFEESKSNVVKLGYKSEVLRAVVEFCITDNVLLFDGRVDEDAAREIVQLIACAHFLNMTALQNKAQILAETLLEMHKHLACAIYDEASLLGDPVEPVKLEALTIIREFPGDSLLSKSGVSFLNAEALSELIGDDGMICEEMTLFLALHKWVVTSESETNPDRLSIAKAIAAAHIRLSSINPSDLTGIVRKSCLVDERSIFEALESQALLAEKESGMLFIKNRKMKPDCVKVSGAGTVAVDVVYEEHGLGMGYHVF
mmetsp:Transcript_6665/g.11835  ORF Transcript_6665/g.11835 Transcript_6665/m.11835 type:complete len:313 (+) Transcript_6665:237-1175(+)